MVTHSVCGTHFSLCKPHFSLALAFTIEIYKTVEDAESVFHNNNVNTVIPLRGSWRSFWWGWGCTSDTLRVNKSMPWSNTPRLILHYKMSNFVRAVLVIHHQNNNDNNAQRQSYKNLEPGRMFSQDERIQPRGVVDCMSLLRAEWWPGSFMSWKFELCGGSWFLLVEVWGM